jgi:hypothetical protein
LITGERAQAHTGQFEGVEVAIEGSPHYLWAQYLKILEARRRRELAQVDLDGGERCDGSMGKPFMRINKYERFIILYIGINILNKING